MKIVAYYEGFSGTHACGIMAPEEIPVESISHLILAFGYITLNDFKITNMDGVSPDMFDQIINLKTRNPNITIMIALGDWAFTDPGTFQSVFSTLVSQCGFDGVDFDWEYPGANDRGGQPEDGVNCTQLLKELRTTIKNSGQSYIVTFTAPTSYWYLQHFDLKAMTTYVDWINLMSDRDNPIGNQVLAHTSLTEIDLALDPFWRNDTDPFSIVLGMGFYGRSFKLEDLNCWKVRCPFSGAGDQGPCTQTDGILSYKEIGDILASTNAKPYYDEDAQVNYTAIDFDDARHSALAALTGD
ncbi:hypothetical protein B7463_g71, partial [Scytalidium lignicola]